MFSVNKMAKFSSNPGKVHFKVLGHLLIYIRYNKNLGLKYYSKIYSAPLYNLLRQARINNDNELMVFSDSSCQDCTYTGRSTGAYIVFYQGVSIDHFTPVPVPVAQYSVETDYNVACTVGMNLLHFRMLKMSF